MVGSSLGELVSLVVSVPVSVSASSPLQAAMPRDIVRARVARPVLRAMRFMGTAFREGLRDRWPRECFRRVFGASGEADWSVFKNFQAMLTEMFWMPLEPSGKGVIRTSVCTSPSLLVARLDRKCWPGFASHSRYHWRQ